MVGILLSYWGGLFSGATLVSGKVLIILRSSFSFGLLNSCKPFAFRGGFYTKTRTQRGGFWQISSGSGLSLRCSTYLKMHHAATHTLQSFQIQLLPDDALSSNPVARFGRVSVMVNHFFQRSHETEGCNRTFTFNPELY